jgi:hypothetical protein
LCGRTGHPWFKISKFKISEMRQLLFVFLLGLFVVVSGTPSRGPGSGKDFRPFPGVYYSHAMIQLAWRFWLVTTLAIGLSADRLLAEVYILPPRGRLLQFVPIPHDEVTKCAFGGPNRQTLFITAGGHLRSLLIDIPGKP